MKPKYFYGIICLVLQLMPIHAFAQIGGASPQNPAIIKPGDQVRITVFRNPELSGTFEVAGDGTIRHPLYQGVKVAGLTTVDAERAVQDFIQRFQANPQLLVETLFPVIVAGQVRVPNLYHLTPDVTVLQAILLAGGVTELGRTDRVRVYRGSEWRVLSLTDSAPTLTGMRVQSGDRIHVEQRRNIFREFVLPAATLATTVLSLMNLYLRVTAN